MIPVLSVSEFISQINDIIAGEFIIEGEVSGFKTSNGKWIFFDLKDDSATLNCFSTIFTLRVPLEDGMKIRVYGYPKIHDKSGRFSLTVQKAELVGEGALKRAYELLKKKLESEGIFAVERKRPLPFLPQRIGVVASGESAAFGDFKRILNNRWGGVEIILRHVLVQGEQAVPDILQALAEFDACTAQTRPDVIVIIRGGGSIEDLAAFNSEEIVRAVYNSRIPVIAGIGHERDVSLVELAADVRASTPSNAAEIVVPDKRDFIAGLDFELEHMEQNLKHQVSKKKQNLDQYFYLISSKLELPIANGRMLVSRFVQSLSALGASLKNKKEAVLFGERLIKSSDPKHLLKKGYSITRNKAGVVIRRPDQVVSGEEIVVELEGGKIKGEVLEN